ncbi:OmpA/MotB domain protein [Candidatus Methylomirabilis lanthanidiphila]|uniref:Peptidoglycan-associated lipoprotein n=1 Tax=Candidatus Methylomirabilis lanthanidiphila TaxID=2211376 RepID=A0A564ZJD4_9BACT|nr:peptidoglycan-associated lipoprotein Pal [Candidatus Methylomirabilis lanthanidiphila]VUZ85460.1 OmpA/MotB domain protein [Candidatus Methylomirabilis lanthanidiphila]
MNGSSKRGWAIRFALLTASVALMIAGCATTASYRPEIDGMKTALAEAKAAGAEMRAPEEYAAAEACLDWMTHEATEFNPFADPDARIRGKCQAAFAALREQMAAAPAATIPAEATRAEEKAVEVVSPQATPEPETARAAEEKASPLQDIFFDFDKSSIRADMKKSLTENVQWLNAHATASIIIEGHCDERGTVEYNQGLGQRRAASIKNYLVAAGINAKRITVVSYGKERPFAAGHDESAWKWNRRAHFVLQ